MSAPELGTLSACQQDALDAIVKWYGDGGAIPLTLGGLAGTGKTVLASLLPEMLPEGTRIAYVAYTGKAVSVLRARLREQDRHDAATSTIHRLLYKPHPVTLCAESGLLVYEKTGFCPAHQLPRAARCQAVQHVSFTPVEDPLAGTDLVVADEASMIPQQLWADLTCHGVPVLAIGDHGQLPPVRSAFSLMASPDLRLEEIHRQAAGSPILAVARWAREQGHIPHGWYGPEVVKIRPHELGCTGLHPGGSDMILCATNATRMYHNAAMRAWHGRTGLLAAGDVVVCLRNNHEEGLVNGLRGTILELTGEHLDAEHPFIEATVSLDGEDEPWSGCMAAEQFGQRSTLGHLPRHLGLFDYGYALTVHKSQGSEAARVLVIEESWPPPGPDRSRWLYTAVTRARQALTVSGW